METSNAETWIYGLLSADATLIGYVGARIYVGVIPDGATFPLILIGLDGTPDDLMVLNATRKWTNARYIVRAINQAESYQGNLETMADRIDTLLHRQSGTNVHACVREQAFQLSEVVDNVQYRHLGGIYRIFAS
jgi:hypothetical protein